MNNVVKNPKWLAVQGMTGMYTRRAAVSPDLEDELSPEDRARLNQVLAEFSLKIDALVERNPRGYFPK